MSDQPISREALQHAVGTFEPLQLPSKPKKIKSTRQFPEPRRLSVPAAFSQHSAVVATIDFINEMYDDLAAVETRRSEVEGRGQVYSVASEKKYRNRIKRSMAPAVLLGFQYVLREVLGLTKEDKAVADVIRLTNAGKKVTIEWTTRDESVRSLLAPYFYQIVGGPVVRWRYLIATIDQSAFKTLQWIRPDLPARNPQGHVHSVLRAEKEWELIKRYVEQQLGRGEPVETIVTMEQVEKNLARLAAEKQLCQND